MSIENDLALIQDFDKKSLLTALDTTTLSLLPPSHHRQKKSFMPATTITFPKSPNSHTGSAVQASLIRYSSAIPVLRPMKQRSSSQEAISTIRI